MVNHDFRKALCASCGEKGIPASLQPYCSVVCMILGRVRLGWRSNPCRIVDLQSGVVLASGPEFSFTSKAIEELQKRAAQLHQDASEGLINISSGVNNLAPDVSNRWETRGASNVQDDRCRSVI